MRTLVALLLFVLVGCSTQQQPQPFKKNLIRPDIIVEFDGNETKVSNIDPISEAIFDLLEADSSQVLLATSTGLDPNQNHNIPNQRITFLYDALLKSGVPDYKIKRLVRYQGMTDKVEVYALPQGWQGVPYDMLHYGFVPKKEKAPVIISTAPSDYVDPEPTHYIEEFLVKEGELQRVMNELVKAVGWSKAVIHTNSDKYTPKANSSYDIQLQKMELPLQPEQVKSIVDFILEREQLSQFQLRLHVEDQIVVLTEKVNQ